MFGFFEVGTFIRYGEKKGAFPRIGQEPIKQKPQDESLLAWQSLSTTSCGLLAPWPTRFKI